MMCLTKAVFFFPYPHGFVGLAKPRTLRKIAIECDGKGSLNALREKGLEVRESSPRAERRPLRQSKKSEFLVRRGTSQCP